MASSRNLSSESDLFYAVGEVSSCLVVCVAATGADDRVRYLVECYVALIGGSEDEPDGYRPKSWQLLYAESASDAAPAVPLVCELAVDAVKATQLSTEPELCEPFEPSHTPTHAPVQCSHGGRAMPCNGWLRVLC